MPQQMLNVGLDLPSPHRPIGGGEHLNDCPLNDSVSETLQWRLQRGRRKHLWLDSAPRQVQNGLEPWRWVRKLPYQAHSLSRATLRAARATILKSSAHLAECAALRSTLHGRARSHPDRPRPDANRSRPARLGDSRRFARP
jgi:hypothetical protein